MKNLYIKTLADCIRNQCKNTEADSGRLQFMVPEISGTDAELLLADCKDIATEYSRQLVFRIADECRTAPGWNPGETPGGSEHGRNTRRISTGSWNSAKS